VRAAAERACARAAPRAAGIDAGELDGLPVYRAGQFIERPEYARWVKEVTGDLKKPAAR